MSVSEGSNAQGDICLHASAHIEGALCKLATETDFKRFVKVYEYVRLGEVPLIEECTCNHT